MVLPLPKIRPLPLPKSDYYPLHYIYNFFPFVYILGFHVFAVFDCSKNTNFLWFWIVTVVLDRHCVLDRSFLDQLSLFASSLCSMKIMYGQPA